MIEGVNLYLVQGCQFRIQIKCAFSNEYSTRNQGMHDESDAKGMPSAYHDRMQWLLECSARPNHCEYGDFAHSR